MEPTLALAERTTAWLQSGGGWAMFVLALGGIIYLWRYGLGLTKQCKEETAGLNKEHKDELARIEKEHREEVAKKDEKIFELLDKTNEMMILLRSGK